MKQSRALSFFEAVINTFIGLLVSYLVWPVAALITGIAYSHSQQIGVVAIFTVASVGRSYVVRRWCERYLHMLAGFLAEKFTRFVNYVKG